MILPALAEYYERLVADPNVEVTTMGFSRKRLSLKSC